MSYLLSALDLVPLPTGKTSGEALRDSLALAQTLDRAGYHRLWYAEHHNMATIASTTPELMIALAAERTSRIRVGSGGVMLPNHAPLKVAETFKMLEALYPGRIDLGLGRAPGTDPATAYALRGNREMSTGDDFAPALTQLAEFGAGPVTMRGTTRTVSAMPEDVGLPDIYILGSSDYGARLSARLGLPFAFAAHFSDLPPEYPMALYRQNFQADPLNEGGLTKPHAILALSALVADTNEEAERLGYSQLVSFARLRTGQRAVLLSPEEAMAYNLNLAEKQVVLEMKDRLITGTADEVKSRIDSLAATTEANEVMITSMAHDPIARAKSYELLSDEYNLALVA